MKPSRGIAIASFAAGTLAVLAACSSTRRGEDVSLSRGEQAQSSGTADQPASCGPYFGDAALNPVSGGADAPFPPPTQFSGRITHDSPKQNGVLGPPYTTISGPYDAHSCDTPNPTPTVDHPAADYHYDAIYLKNWTNADACISASGFFVPGVSVSDGYMVGAYVGPFDPNDIGKNAVVASVGDHHWHDHFSFKVPANEVFEIVLSASPQKYTDANGNAVDQLDLTWGFNVANCGEPQSGGTSSGGGGGSSGGGAADGGGNSKSW